MRALSFLFAALLGIALAMIAPALAGPGTGSVTAPTVIAADTAAPIEPAAELSDAAAPADQADELEASLLVELGLDVFQADDAA